MKRKLVTYFPIAVLALGLTLGMAAALMALQPSSSVAPASASNSATAITVGSGPRDGNTLVDLAPVTAPVTGTITIIPTPDKPGAAAKYEVKFTTSSVLTNGLDTISIRFDDDWNSQIPTTIDKSQVTISADRVLRSDAVFDLGVSNQAVSVQSITVTREGPETDEPEITVTVPDMATGDALTTGSGGNPIDTGAVVTIVFAQSAGIKNPTEARPNKTIQGQATGHPATIWTSDDSATASKVTARVNIPAVVELNTVGDPRGTKVTAVAKGFEGSTTVTFWRDGDADGVRDGGEIDLCSALAGSDDTATCTFTVNNPPFAAGTATTLGTCTVGVFGGLPDSTVTLVNGCNYVNATDGESRTSTIRDQADITRQTFLLEGFIGFSPATADPGDTVTVQLKDFVAGGLETVRLGSRFICSDPGVEDDCTQVVPDSGELNFEIVVPDGVPTGKATMFIKGFGARTEDDDLVIGGAALTITPATAVPNQRVSVSGSGFSEGGGTFINGTAAQEGPVGGPFVAPCTQRSQVTIGGEAVHRSKINDGDAITIDNGGTWSSSIDLPITSATTTEGPREFKFIDCRGREGKADLTFPDQLITVTPEEGRVGTDVRVKGTGFAAKNNDGNSVTVLVTYTAGLETNTATVTPDSGGLWETIIQVPSDAAIPSTNTVKAEFNLFDPTTDLISATKSITTVTHRVPAAAITLDKVSGVPGTIVTLKAVGFKRFTPVLTLKVGTIEVTPSPKPSTDEFGNATITFVVPGADSGIQTVELKVDVTTGSQGFTVLPTGTILPPGSTTPIPVADALRTPLGTDFMRAFHFNNQTKVWTFNVTGSEFDAINTLKDVVPGQVYWVNVANDKTFTLCGRTTTLYKGWNQSPC